MTTTDTDYARLAEEAFAEHRALAQLGPPISDAFADYRRAVEDKFDTGRQLERDLGELRKRRDLLPAEGYKRLEREARADAESKAREADLAGLRAYAALEEALTEAALPAVPAEREPLARGELEVALRGADEGAVRDFAARGSREAVGVLVRTGFGRTLLESLGLDAERLQAEARRDAALRAAERGESPRELAAGAALLRLGRLKNASTAAALVLLDAGDREPYAERVRAGLA